MIRNQYGAAYGNIVDYTTNTAGEVFIHTQNMTGEVERASKELQCEAALLFITPNLAQHQEVWQSLGYEARTVKDLGVRAWQDAAMESMKPGTVMLFKQLRKDRVLRPV